MSFTLQWTKKAEEQYREIEAAAKLQTTGAKSSQQSGLLKQVNKTLAHLQRDPTHPSLNSHQYRGYPSPFEPEKFAWESYVQNNTPGAYRVFWVYGSGRGVITILAITPHP